MDTVRRVEFDTEESERCRDDAGTNSESWYLRTSKLALALAIIGSKPPRKSGREYTEYLVTCLCSKDENWRAKAQALEAEVLRLRQKLLLTKIKPKGKRDTGDNSLEILSQDLMGSLNDTTQLEGDSGCDTSSGQGNNTMSLLHSQEPAGFTSHQTSLKPLCGSSYESSKEKTIRLHTQFLQNLLGLRQLTEPGYLTTDPLVSHRDVSLVTDSVCQLLRCMLSYCTNPKLLLPSSSFLLEAAQVLASVLDHGSLCKPALTQCMTRVEEFFKDLVSLILRNKELNRFQNQESLADCLILLGGCSLLRASLISLLLSQINRFADELSQACQSQRSACPHFDVSSYENTFYLFWILEQLLQSQKKEDRSDQHCEQMESQQKLERTALFLSEEFPLFSIYMWRIGAYFKSTDAEDS
ncbi:meiosis-specific protein MEI4 isoform X2 [Acipenser ruthenus]|uniref:meiosis-specific protein MEI4 isoform X2 n=1 Tax=Acipenser ruthenus TaxID=7906 RepID=UPI002741C45D|nr:meiosis-specific protein MEI4 isoform X2 [Acipenser ruthenus]